MSDSFYDREPERKIISDIIKNDECDGTRIILLYGHSGVGKSRLIEQMFSTVFKHQPHLQVKIPNIPNLSSSALRSYEYFNRLYEVILAKCKDELNADDPRSSDPLINYRVSQGINLAVQVAASSVGLDPLLGDTEKIELLLKRDFVLEYLKKTPHLVDIHNIQAIDPHSWDILKEIIEQLHQSVFVLEYTLENEIDNGHLRLCIEFRQSKCDVKLINLKSLNDTDALRLLPNKTPVGLERKLILKAYRESCGNLCQIIFYYDSNPNSSDFIKETLLEMVRDKKQSTNLFLLNIVYLHRGRLTENSLKYFATSTELNSCHPFISDLTFGKAFEYLISQKFVQEHEGELFIHDSVLAALNKQMDNPVLRQAYQTLVYYYTSWKTSTLDQQAYRLSQLFFLYLRFGDGQLLSILPEIRRHVLSNKYPQVIYQSLRGYIDDLNQQPNPSPVLYREVYKLLTEICIEAGDAKTAWEMINNIHGMPPEELRVLKGRVYELGMQKEQISAISTLIEESAPNSYERLLLELSKLHVALRVLPQKESNKLIQIVVENQQYRQFPEFAFVLSDQAELVDSPQRAIDLYQEGIRMLMDAGQLRLAGCLYTNICMSYGYMGKLEEAERNLTLAKESGIDEPVYLNNLVALDLLRKQVTPQNARMLKDALLLHANKFEQLIIHNNLLIVQVLLKEWKQADAEYNYLKESGFETFQYGEFLHLCYQNLFFYCSRKGLKKERAIYLDCLRSLSNSPNTNEGTKSVIRAMLEKRTDSDIFYAQYPYRAEFLCYWGIPSIMRK